MLESESQMGINPHNAGGRINWIILGMSAILPANEMQRSHRVWKSIFEGNKQL